MSQSPEDQAKPEQNLFIVNADDNYLKRSLKNRKRFDVEMFSYVDDEKQEATIRELEELKAQLEKKIDEQEKELAKFKELCRRSDEKTR
ncbi:hypothetical protein ACLMJK_001197 [Lecanora helva]